MPVSSKRVLKIIGVILVTLTVIVIVAGFIANTRLEKMLTTKLHEAGFDAKSVSVSVWSTSVTIDSLVYAADTTAKNPHRFFVQKIKARGFHVIAFFKRQEIILEDIVIHQGNLAYNKNYTLKTDSSGQKSSQDKIKAITLKHFAVSDFNIAILDDSLPETEAFINDFEFGNFELALEKDTSYSIEWIEVDIENLKQSEKTGFHTFEVSKIHYNSREKHLEVDSFQVVAKYNKADFARIAQIQKTRLDVLLPKIIFEGFNHERFVADSTFEVTRITIPNPVVHAYRDKRYPFVRDWIMPLPIEGIRRLPFKLRIDSILIHGANIAYEEFSDKGLDESGTITFNKLDASFAGLTTETDQPGKDKFCTLIADCKVMDNGSLHATFKLPLNSKVNYEAHGNLRNMDLTSLNPTLGNLTRIAIKEGTLNDLHYNFSYNDNVSTGEVLINYSNLNLSALKKEKEREVNKVLSAVINTVVRSNKDKSMDQDKRTGKIDIERDKKRFVFQFWWKSLLDGMQSTFIDSGKK